jgi:predicted O-methyltransferase YrrM
MDKIRFILKFLNYKLFSGHKYGHGIHSPFVFEFVTRVLNDGFRYKEYDEVEKIRRKMRSEERTILFNDYGAGSGRNRQGETITSSGRKRSAMVRIKDIARYSAVSKKFGQLLFRIVRYYRPATILELGTSLGISTMYLAMANRDTTVISIEADRNLAEIARLSVFNAGLHNVEVINDRFENALPPLIERLGNKLFVFIDGNHEKSPTLQYFNQLLVKSGSGMIMAVDDIHWSPGMGKAWQEIKSDHRVKITMDLFFMGLVFFNRGVQKQNFVIRY